MVSKEKEDASQEEMLHKTKHRKASEGEIFIEHPLDSNVIMSYDPQYKIKPVWRMVLFIGFWHLVLPYGLYLAFTEMCWKSLLYTFLMTRIGGWGITMGAHRLYSHRAFKARFPLRLLLVFMQTTTMQGSIYYWARDHRVHHKFSDTDADPHNSARGFFFAHTGRLMCKKNALMLKKGKTVDCKDMYNDWLIYIQHEYYYPIMLLIAAISVWVPMHYWGESFRVAFFVTLGIRYVAVLNGTALVNSAAHYYGWRPYDKSIPPTENKIVAWITSGEGYHNYHHSFPQDYRSSEYRWRLNSTTVVIDLMALLGLAYDRRVTTVDKSDALKARLGDGNPKLWGDY